MTNEKDKKDEKKPDEKLTIKTAKNFSELYDALKEAGEIIGSDGTEYKADNLITRIDELRRELKEIQEKGGIKRLKALTHESVKELIRADENLEDMMLQITRTEGLRDMAVKLAIDEVIKREVSRGINEETKKV